MNRTKRILTAILGISLSILLLLSATHAGMASVSLSLNDSSSDVIKFTLRNGFPQSVAEGVSEGSVDITAISASLSTSSTTNSTFTLTFSGSPQVDAYHYYWVWFSATAFMENNNTHYLNILFHASVTGINNETNGVTPGADLFAFGMLKANNSDYVEYFTPSLGQEWRISYSISGSNLVLSFNISDIFDNEFMQYWSQVNAIDANPNSPFQSGYDLGVGFMAYAYKSSEANTTYNAFSGTYWWDFAPDDTSSNFIPVSSSESETATTEPESETEGNDTAIAIPTPSFTLVEAFVVTSGVTITTVLVRLRRTRNQ